MGCDKGAVEKMNRKVNTRTSLFLFHLLAEQLSLKSPCPPQFFALLHFRREGIEGEVGGRGRRDKKGGKKEDSHSFVCVSVCAWI